MVMSWAPVGTKADASLRSFDLLLMGYSRVPREIRKHFLESLAARPGMNSIDPTAPKVRMEDRGVEEGRNSPEADATGEALSFSFAATSGGCAAAAAKQDPPR